MIEIQILKDGCKPYAKTVTCPYCGDLQTWAAIPPARCINCKEVFINPNTLRYLPQSRVRWHFSTEETKKKVATEQKFDRVGRKILC